MIQSFCVRILVIVVLLSSCGERLPAKAFLFNKQFDSLFQAIARDDTIYFEGENSVTDTFILTMTDSMITDRVGCFMCPVPAKSKFRYYKQYPENYWAVTRYLNQGKKNESVELREDVLVSIVIEGVSGVNSANISFRDFSISVDGNLGEIKTDTLFWDERVYSAYYEFQNENRSLESSGNSTVSLYVTLMDGIIGYRCKNGVVRKRIYIPKF